LLLPLLRHTNALAISPPAPSSFVRRTGPLLSDFSTFVPEERLEGKKRAPWAVAAAYLGLFSALGFPAPFAIVSGILGLRQLKAHPEFAGRAGSIFGIVAGCIGTAGLVFVLNS
jgi:hypothetical protein